MKKGQRSAALAVAISLALIFAFMAIASGFNSDWGNVRVTDVYYPNTEGTMLHAQLFVPKTASSENPAPAILNMHGGSDYLQSVGNYSIELARRGYVVLSVDAYGSGESDYLSGSVASNAGGAGGEKSSALKMDGGVSVGLEQLFTYQFVDQSNIGLIGHSMGGTYIANAALDYADHIKAIMPWGSGSFVDMMKSHDSSKFTFNVGYINASCDEMVVFATGEKTAELLKDESLKKFVGTEETIVAGQTYGSFADGTARVIYTPGTTHIGNIINKDSIGSLVSFFEQAIPTGTAVAKDDQVWPYKETFCVLAIIALLAFVISLAYALLYRPEYATLEVKAERSAVKMNKWVQLVGVLLCVAVPALTLHQVGLRLAGIKPSAFFPMNWANSLAWLAVVNAAILLVAFLVWHFLYGKKHGGSAAAYGFTNDEDRIDWRQILRSFGFAALMIVCVYAVVNLCYGLFKIDFRFWQFGIMPITLRRFGCILGYLLCYLFAFGVLNTVSIAFANIGVGDGKGSAAKQYLLGWLIGAGGYAIILAVYYIGLKTTQRPPFFFAFPPFANGHPNSLVFSMKTICLVPTFTFLSIANTALYRKTKNIYVGWFFAAIMAAMILIGSNAFAC